MPHISKKKLKRKVFLDIYTRLFEALATDQKAGTHKKFIAELLTPTEKIMIAKRLALIVMLGRGCTLPEIVKALKVSPSTVERIEKRFNSSYKGIGKCFISEDRPDFWSDLEKLLLMGMPPRVGKERWHFLYKN